MKLRKKPTPKPVSPQSGYAPPAMPEKATVPSEVGSVLNMIGALCADLHGDIQTVDVELAELIRFERDREHAVQSILFYLSHAVDLLDDIYPDVASTCFRHHEIDHLIAEYRAVIMRANGQ
jgi:hypothetical protein